MKDYEMKTRAFWVDGSYKALQYLLQWDWSWLGHPSPITAQTNTSRIHFLCRYVWCIIPTRILGRNTYQNFYLSGMWKTQAIREKLNYFLWKKTHNPKFLFQRQLLQLSMKQHLSCQQFTLHKFTWPEECSLFLKLELEECNVQSGKTPAMCW